MHCARAAHSPARGAKGNRNSGLFARDRRAGATAPCVSTTADSDGIPLVVRSGHHLPPCRNMMGYNTTGNGYNKLFTQVRAQCFVTSVVKLCLRIFSVFYALKEIFHKLSGNRFYDRVLSESKEYSHVVACFAAFVLSDSSMFCLCGLFSVCFYT